MRHHRYAAPGLLGLAVALLLSACQGSSTPSGDSADAATGAPAPSGGTAAQAPGSLSLAFAGDVHFEGGVSGVPRRDGSTLGAMSKALRDADLAMVNLESALTTRGEPTRKELEVASNRYWFNSPPAALDVLDRSGVDVVSVANNHGADYGAAGLRDTARIAEDSPVAVLGAGLDTAQAYTPHRVTIEGTDVAVLAADASPRESVDPLWEVTPGKGPGLASGRAGEDARLLEAVRASAATDDLVVVYVHWGEELESCSTNPQEVLARRLSEAGADVVVGTHAHVPLGAGTVGDTYVSYGLGNFFWYHGRQPDTGVLRLDVTGGEVVGNEWLPARIPPQGGNPRPLTGEARADAVREWRNLRSCTDLAPGPGKGATQPETSAEPEPEPVAPPEASQAPAPAVPEDVQATLPAFTSTVRRIGSGLAAEMTAHDPATCPTPLSDLRRLGLPYVDFDGNPQRGAMIVAADAADDVTRVFERLYEARFPIQQMRLIDVYGGDDNASMAANNTSAYNCRTVAGTTTFSDHAYGRAIDINPVQNPYVMGESVLPQAGREFVDVQRGPRAEPQPGVVREGDVVSRAFTQAGWEWGGDYADPDYQHFYVP